MNFIKQPIFVVAAAEEAWLPTDIAGLYMWLDFNDITTLFQDTAATSPVTTTGQTIARANSKTVAARNVQQSTAGSRPAYTTAQLNGDAAAVFTTDSLATAYGETLTQPLTLATVAKVDGNSQFVMDGDDGTNRAGIFVSSGAVYSSFAGTNLVSTVTRNANYNLLLTRLHGNNSLLRVNGREFIAAGGANNVDGLRLGANGSGTAVLAGGIRMAFVIDAALTPGELSELEYFMRQESGLAAGYSDHKFQIGGDAGQTSGFCPLDRMFWRFGAADTDINEIQFCNVDTWVSGSSFTTIPVATGGCVWHAARELFYIYGGKNSSDVTQSSIYSFDPLTQVLTLLTEAMPTAHRQPGAAVHPASGKVYLFGGSGNNTDAIYVHDPVAATCTDTTANMPQVISGVGAVWAENISKFVLIGGSDQTTDYADILTYDPATPTVNPVDTGVNVSVHGRENLHGAYYDGSIYIFGGYSYQLTTYYNLIERIDLLPSVTCTTLAETTHRADDDATAHYDSVTGKIFVGPWLHSSQATDNNGPDKRIILEFDPVTETLTTEPTLT